MIAAVARPAVDWFALSPELSLLAAAGICLLAAVLVPAAVGVPLITPVPALIVSPAGRPVADQV